MTRQVDQLARHVRRLGNHELNELLVQFPKPSFAALVEVALGSWRISSLSSWLPSRRT